MFAKAQRKGRQLDFYPSKKLQKIFVGHQGYNKIDENLVL